MALLTVQDVVQSGLAPTYAAASASDTFAPGVSGSAAKIMLHYKNSGGSISVVTVDDPTSQTTVGAVAFNPDFTVWVPITTGDRLILLEPVSRFVNPATALVTITATNTACLTVAVLRLYTP